MGMGMDVDVDVGLGLGLGLGLVMKRGPTRGFPRSAPSPHSGQPMAIRVFQ